MPIRTRTDFVSRNWPVLAQNTRSDPFGLLHYKSSFHTGLINYKCDVGIFGAGVESNDVKLPKNRRKSGPIRAGVSVEFSIAKKTRD